MQLKSTIKKIKEINLDQKILLTQLHADKGLVEQHQQRLKNIFKSDTQEQLNQKLTNIVIRDNLFNEAMLIVVPCFEIKLDEDEVKSTAEKLKTQFANASPEVVSNIAGKVITKTLIFQELAKEWKIEVTDDEVRASLDQYYKFSNESIRPFLENKEKFEGIRNVMLEEKTANTLIGKFKHEIKLDPPPANKETNK